MILKLEVSRYPGLPSSLCVLQGFSKLWKVIFISFYLPRNNFAILSPSFVHEELSSMAWKLKHIQMISTPVNENPINIFSAQPFIERYLVSLSKTLKTSTWKMCSSFLWLKFSNIQPNGGSNPHHPPPQNKRLCKGSQWIFIKESQGELTWLTRFENVLKWSCFPWFPLFSSFSLLILVKYNSKWTTTDNLKLGCLPDSRHTLLTHVQKILRFRQIWQRSIYTPWH